MRLHHIAVNNLRRRIIRSVFLLLALILGVATVVTLLTITSAMKKDLGEKFEGIGSKIIIKPKSDKLAFTYGPIVIASGVSYDVQQLTEASLEKVKAQGQLNLISPKLLETTTINDKPAMIVGIDFKQEMGLKDYWSVEGQVPEQGEGLLIGSKVVAARDIKINDEISIQGQPFTVMGIIGSTASEEDGLIFMDIKKSQMLFNKEGIYTFIEANAAGGKTGEQLVDQIVQDLRRGMPEAEITPVKEAVDERKQLVDRFANFSIIISAIVVIIGALLIMSTMFSSIKERTAEIGIFRAIGFRKSHIIRIILTEAGILSLAGSVLGCLTGFLAASQGVTLATKTVLDISWNPLLLMAVIISGVAVGLLSSLYPAIKASRLDPVEALRFI